MKVGVPFGQRLRLHLMNACVDCLAALLDHPPHIVVCDAKIVGIVRLCADPRENSAFFGSSHASGGTIYLLESGVRRRPKPKMAMSGSCQISRHSRTRPAFPAGKGGRATTAMRLTIHWRAYGRHTQESLSALHVARRWDLKISIISLALSKNSRRA